MGKKKNNWSGRSELRKALKIASLPPDQRPEISAPIYFYHFRATLRIAGAGLDFDAISQTLGLQPTHTHRQGARRK